MEQAAPANPPSVINCIVYAREGVHRDVPLAAIGGLLARDADSFAWQRIGLSESSRIAARTWSRVSRPPVSTTRMPSSPICTATLPPVPVSM